MEHIGNAIPSIEYKGKETCSRCGNEYKVYQTPRGILGACKPCEDRKLMEKLNLPVKEDLSSMRLKNQAKQISIVPTNLELATINSYQPHHSSQGRAKNWLTRYIRDFEKGTAQSLVLSGQAGLGKSHLAFATKRALQQRGFHVVYIDAPRLLDRFRDSYDLNTNYTKNSLLDLISRLDVFILDDIGKEYIKGNGDNNETWGSEILNDVLEVRQGKAKIMR